MQFLNPRLQEAIQNHQSGNLAQAEIIYRELLQEGVNEASVFPNLINVLNQQGKAQESLKLLEDAIQKQAVNVQLKLLLSQTHMSLGNLAEGRSIVESLAQQYPQMGEVHYQLGNILLQERKVDEALKVFEKTLELIPHLAEAHYNVGTLLYQKGDTKTAEAKWKEAIRYQPAMLPALLNLGHHYIAENLFSEAIQHLNQILQYDPQHFSALKMLGMAKHAIGEIDEALHCYLKIHNEQKPDEEVLTLIANANRDLDRFEVAEKYYQQVLAVNPVSPIAKENLEKISGRKIEGWHFDMLSDLERNTGYEKAINYVVKEGDTVLDIGTGSGLLSMMCARAGAKQVYTCETIEAIANTAKKVIDRNNYSDNIDVFHLRSTSLKIGKEIPQKVDVIVSEIFDSGLLGEGVLSSIRHAKANLLKEGGKIIPAAATIKAQLIQSTHLKSIAPISHISGFDLSDFGKFQINDTYRQVFIKNIPHVSLSDIFDILPVDFYQLPPFASPEDPNVKIVEIEIKTDGILQAIAFWFDVHFNHEETLSSGPDGEMFHWGQAVFCFPNEKQVKKGEKVKIRVKQSEMKVLFDLI